MKNILIKNLLLTLSFLIVSCSDDDSIALFFDQDAYNSNRELWENSRLLNYSFTQEKFTSGTGPEPKLFTGVKNGELDTIYVQSDQSSAVKYSYYETIDEVFDFIDYIVEYCNEELNSSDTYMNAATIKVEYHPSYYYPTKVICSGRYPDGYDGGLSTQIFITDFEKN